MVCSWCSFRLSELLTPLSNRVYRSRTGSRAEEWFKLPQTGSYAFGFPPILTHGVAPHLDPMRVVNQSVQDAVSQRGIADLLVPARDRQLRGEDRRTHLVAVLADLPKVRRSGSDSGAMAQSSITRTSIRPSRARRLRKLPSARVSGIAGRLEQADASMLVFGPFTLRVHVGTPVQRLRGTFRGLPEVWRRGRKCCTTQAKCTRFAAELGSLAWLEEFRFSAGYLSHIQTLERHGIRFLSVTQGLDTNQNDPAGRFLLHILGAAAEFERSLIRERVHAGIKAARKAGKALGRPQKSLRSLLGSRATCARP